MRARKFNIIEYKPLHTRFMIKLYITLKLNIFVFIEEPSKNDKTNGPSIIEIIGPTHPKDIMKSGKLFNGAGF